MSDLPRCIATRVMRRWRLAFRVHRRAPLQVTFKRAPTARGALAQLDETIVLVSMRPAHEDETEIGETEMKSTSMTIQTAVEGAVTQVNCQELPSGRWRYTVVKQHVRMIEGSLVPTDAHYIAAHGERATKLLAIADAQRIADRGTVQKKRRA